MHLVRNRVGIATLSYFRRRCQGRFTASLLVTGWTTANNQKHEIREFGSVKRIFNIRKEH
jgi:hypothetical protein